MTTYKVPADNYDGLLATIEKLNKRAKRNKLVPIIVKEVGTEVVTPEDLSKDAYVVYLLEIEGTSPVIPGGWRLLSIIDHFEGVTILRNIPNAGVEENELASYRNASSECDHCHKDRKRSMTFILKNEEGQYKQVGKSCLRDFTEYASVDSIALMAELLIELEKAISEAGDYDEDEEKSNRSLVKAIVTYLPWVVASIRMYGFISKKAAMEAFDTTIIPTSTDAMNNLKDAKQHKNAYEPSEEDRKMAATVIEWAKAGMNVEGPLNDYLYTIFQLFTSGVFHVYKHSGFVASAVNAYYKSLAEAHVEGAKGVSTHQGAIGDKLTIEKMFVKRVVGNDGPWGYSYFYILVDAGNNAYCYSSKNHIMEEGSTYDLKGTIKDLQSYKGTDQTVLTRCKVLKEYAEAIA